MKTTTKRASKKAALVPQSKEELRTLIASILSAQTTREKAIADRDSALAAQAAEIEKKHGYNATIDKADKDAARGLELVEMWAAANKAEFGEARSLVEANARFGWRLGNWAFQTSRKQSEVMEFLQAIMRRGLRPEATERQKQRCTFAALFLRIKTSLDKEQAIAERDNPAARRLFRRAGITIEQEETFYLDPEREGQKPPLITTPAT